MPIPRLAAVAATVTALVLPGCNSSTDSQPSGLPPADGAALWTFLGEQNYQQNWSLWPNRGERYAGTEPHGMLLTTYVNQLARDALQTGAARMPAGAIIVKENYSPEGELMAITSMYKVSGYDANANDWFWLANSPAGVIESQGRVAMCIDCHRGAANFDMVWLWQQDASQ